MLKSFFEYVKKHKTFKWVHWNMINATYGFEAISNRYRILGGTPVEIEDQFKYDFPNILGLTYTYNFENDKPNGKLLNLALRNKITDKDALTGQLEAQAFETKDFLSLHMSTSRKVEIIDRILTLAENNQLRVEASSFKIYGLSVPGIFEIVRNNWILIALWSILMAILGMAIEPVVQKIFGTAN